MSHQLPGLSLTEVTELWTLDSWWRGGSGAQAVFPTSGSIFRPILHKISSASEKTFIILAFMWKKFFEYMWAKIVYNFVILPVSIDEKKILIKNCAK